MYLDYISLKYPSLIDIFHHLVIDYEFFSKYPVVEDRSKQVMNNLPYSNDLIYQQDYYINHTRQLISVVQQFRHRPKQQQP